MGTRRTLDRSSAPGWADRAWGAVATVRPRLMTTAAIAQALADTERLISRLHATQVQLLTDLARPGRWDDVVDLVEGMTSRLAAVPGADPDLSDERDVAALELMVVGQAQRMAATEASGALRISSLAAAHRVGTAVELTTTLPGTWSALHEGEIDRSTTAMLLERTSILEASARQEVEERILPLADRRSLRRLRVLTDRAIIVVDPEAATARERKARTDRDVNHRPLPDGMGMITATLPADGALSVQTMLEVMAGADPDRTRLIGARRADALVGIADALLTRGHLDLRPLFTLPVDSPLLNAPSPTAPSPAAAETLDLAVELGLSAHPPLNSWPHAEPQSFAPQVELEPPSNSPSINFPTGFDPSPVDLPANSAPIFLPTTAPPLIAPPLTAPPLTALPLTAPPVANLSPPAEPLLNAAPATFAPPTRQGRPVDLVVTLSLATLAGLDQLPGNLTGHGAITAEFARTLAAAARSVTLLAVNPESGAAVGIGARTYRPRQRLKDQVLVLDERCSWPGCSQQSWRCDLDHRREFNHHDPARGGPTHRTNLDPQCRWHHLLKTHTGWTVQRAADRSVIITSPAGVSYEQDAVEFSLPGEWLDRRCTSASAARSLSPSPSAGPEYGDGVNNDGIAIGRGAHVFVAPDDEEPPF